ncbi:hypothetical protein JL721_8481 [Aureococcus anophagefferens]|nr:hypothetical protein JL721_8481 [Aureococcus anophagefferens]
MRGPAAEEEEEDFEEENSTCCPGCCDGEMSVEGTVSGMSRLAIILCFPTPQTSCCSLISWIVGCANFSAQYNYNSITLAILMLERAGKDVPTWATSSLTSVIFLGSVFGQLCLGFLGDAVGRGVGLALTLVLIIGGAFLSSAAWDYETEPSTSVYASIILARFVLGVGVGGVYPLSATAAFEDTREGESAHERARGVVRAAWGLFWQMPGQAAVYVVALVLVGTDSLTWTIRARLLLLSGAPRRDRPPPGDRKAASNAAEERRALFAQASTQRALLGCCGCWMFFDVYSYGVSVYSPVILEWIFGDSEALSLDCWENLLCSVVGFPAVALTIYALQHAYGGDVARVQTLGFTARGGVLRLPLRGLAAGRAQGRALRALRAAAGRHRLRRRRDDVRHAGRALFPRRIRSTCNGAAAATGKLGALVGTYAAMPIADVSTVALFLGFGLVALAGGALTSALLQPDFDKRDGEADRPRDEATGLLRGGAV